MNLELVLCVGICVLAFFVFLHYKINVDNIREIQDKKTIQNQMLAIARNPLKAKGSMIYTYYNNTNLDKLYKLIRPNGFK